MTKEQTGMDGSGSLQPGPVLHGGRKNANRIQFGVDPLSVETEYVDLNAKSAEPQMDVKAPERPKIQLVTSEIEEDEFDEGPQEPRPKSVLRKIADNFRVLSPRRLKSPETKESASGSSVTTSKPSSTSPSNSSTGESGVKSGSSGRDSLDSEELDAFDSLSRYSRTLSLAVDHVNRERSTSADRRSPSFFRLPSRTSSLPILRPVELPALENPILFGDTLKRSFDNIVAMSLYSGRNEKFMNIAESFVNEVAGGLLPLSWEEPLKNLYLDRIIPDVDSEDFLFDINENLKYIKEKYMDHPEYFSGESAEATHTDLSDNGVQYKVIFNEEFLSVEFTKGNVLKMTKTVLGKGSTIAKSKSLNVDNKISVAHQNVLITPCDIFYYPGMLKLVLFFSSEFDPSCNTDFLYQFVSTFYSGVYGPSRKDLYYITRFEDIPESVIPIEMVLDSYQTDTEAGEIARAKIDAAREYFLDPKFRDLIIKDYTKEEIRYKKLDPVPKTIEDVLEASKLILRMYWKAHNLTSQRPEDIDEFVYDEANIGHLQSFFLDTFTFEDVLHLFTTLVIDLDPSTAYRDHSASFLYAAYIEIILDKPARGYLMDVSELENKLKEMWAVNINPRAFRSIHGQSVRVADTDLLNKRVLK